jgi:hypothetical protein
MAGVYVFGIPGIVLGPAIFGPIKAVADSIWGDLRSRGSLLLESEAKQSAEKTSDNSSVMFSEVESPLRDNDTVKDYSG